MQLFLRRRHMHVRGRDGRRCRDVDVHFCRPRGIPGTAVDGRDVAELADLVEDMDLNGDGTEQAVLLPRVGEDAGLQEAKSVGSGERREKERSSGRGELTLMIILIMIS